MKKIEIIKYIGIDGFNRPIFKGNGKNFYGCCDILFSIYADEKEVLDNVTEKDITFFGSFFGCEPMGTTADNIKIFRNQYM